MIVPIGELEHEVPVGGHADPGVYDRQGYSVARRVFEPRLIRQLRAPLIEGLVADGHVQRVENEEDRFTWCGERSSFDVHLGPYREKLVADAEELLVASGIANKAIDAMWGRQPLIWQSGYRVFVMMPDDPDRVHRDGWHMTGYGGPDEHLNVWIPLTAVGIDDGPLAIAAGSHQIPDQPAVVPPARVMHLEVLANSGNMPTAEELAPLWRTTSFEIGDAMAFRPDNVHSASANTSPYLRIAIGLLAQDARVPWLAKAGLAPDPGRELIPAEWLTLAILAVQPSTAWQACQAFLPRGIIGRLWTDQFAGVAHPAFKNFEKLGLIEDHQIQAEGTSAGHRYFHITQAGRGQVCEWLVRPSQDDLLSVKLLFCDWLGLDATGLLASRVELGSPDRLPNQILLSHSS